VYAKELVIQYPIGLHVVVGLTSHHLALNPPASRQVIYQIIAPFRRCLRGDRAR
jgi:hypothetical protein